MIFSASMITIAKQEANCKAFRGITSTTSTSSYKHPATPEFPSITLASLERWTIDARTLSRGNKYNFIWKVDAISCDHLAMTPSTKHRYDVERFHNEHTDFEDHDDGQYLALIGVIPMMGANDGSGSNRNASYASVEGW